ncbi:DUF1737 domain-containing protein [Sessilibacter corallicola]|uniref:DUF1737 domain-containing protein n=1 Tax=Sessilibacter corallicola TaxID=2904075 RepID=A0ABQ0ACH7_9GAMM|nr:DUF1737 domain-containing protein [Sessilibacter corallicola]MCE2027297.1 DUF1737 domain-containing protein [Sessilibacter corallicola]
MKKAEYKVVSGTNGFPELEEKVSKLLNQGWKPVGGIGFNAGYPYQAMAKVVTVSTAEKANSNKNKQQLSKTEETV